MVSFLRARRVPGEDVGIHIRMRGSWIRVVGNTVPGFVSPAHDL